MKSVGKLWQLSHYHTYYRWWSLNRCETGTFVHTGVCFLFLFVSVFPCLVLSVASWGRVNLAVSSSSWEWRFLYSYERYSIYYIWSAVYWCHNRCRGMHTIRFQRWGIIGCQKVWWKWSHSFATFLRIQPQYRYFLFSGNLSTCVSVDLIEVLLFWLPGTEQNGYNKCYCGVVFSLQSHGFHWGYKL